jgi:hypothetical protein
MPGFPGYREFNDEGGTFAAHAGAFDPQPAAMQLDQLSADG